MAMRFKGRIEKFGSLLFDRQKKEYSTINRLGASILRAVDSGDLPRLIDEYRAILASGDSKNEDFEELEYTVRSFLDASSISGYLDSGGKSNVDWVNDAYREEIHKGSLTAPTAVYMDVTRRCNLKCRHCGLTTITRFENELTREEWAEVFRQMEDVGAMELSIIGGEPFIRKDILGIVRDAAGRGIKIFISTNALLVTPRLLRELEEAGISGLKVSIEGADREGYEFIRGKGTYREFRKKLGVIAQSPISLGMGATIMKPNLAGIENMVKFATLSGAGILFFNLVKKWGDNVHLIPNRGEYEKFLRLMIEEIYPRYGGRIRINLPPSFYPAPQEGTYLFDNYGCVAGNSVLHIDADGWVTPCNFIQSLPAVDNIRKMPLRDIWLNSSPFRKIRSIKTPSRCAGCEYYLPCRGGCRAQPKNIEDPDVFCIRGSAVEGLIK